MHNQNIPMLIGAHNREVYIQNYDLSFDRPLLTSEIHKSNDFYGHGYCLKNYSNMNQYTPLKLAIEHGVYMPNDEPWSLDLEAKVPGFISSSKYRLKVNQEKSDKIPIAIGPLIHYATPALDTSSFSQEKNRLGKNILVFPMHSTHHLKPAFNQDEFLEKVLDLKKHYDTVRVCLYWTDIHSDYYNVYQNHGLEVVCVGHMFDPHFLSRLKSLIHLSDGIMSNHIGSHAFYAIHENKPVYIVKQNVVSTGLNSEGEKYIEDNKSFINEIYDFKERILNRLPSLLQLKTHIHPDEKFVLGDLMGSELVRTPEELKTILTTMEDIYSVSPIKNKPLDFLGLVIDKYEVEKSSTNIFQLKKEFDLLESMKASKKYDFHTGLNESSQPLKEIKELIDLNKFDMALQKLNLLKSHRTKIENLDFYRALCFYNQKSYPAALQACLEELRYYPNNQLAIDLKKTLSKDEASTIQDSEFQFLFSKIKDYTMVGEPRLYALYQNAKKVCLDNKPGNFVECGVAAGGTSAMLAYVIKTYSKIPRKIFSFDSFEGMPEPTAEDVHKGMTAQESGWGTGTCSSPEDSVKEITALLNASEYLETVKGYFCDTLPIKKRGIGKIAFLHMDGDWYDSTKDILKNLYNQVDQGGYIQVDDYGFWEGCRQAIHEWEAEKSLTFEFTKIDATGVYFFKPDAFAQGNINLVKVNLGCGGHFNDEWINVDFNSKNPKVIISDLSKTLPFDNSSIDVLYHSHLLEHFDKNTGINFIKECMRILKPGGLIRIVVPDLENIVQSYLLNLHEIKKGNLEAKKRYDWTIVELLDQMVRMTPGGEMLKYWNQSPMPAEDFVVSRLGDEVLKVIRNVQKSKTPTSLKEPTIQEQVEFRSKGEIHQWMYDEFSLGRLLVEVGFVGVERQSANQSNISDFNSYELDLMPDGKIRKPDSLFMEAYKPLESNQQ